MHFQTYYILFFLEELWSGNIHDTIEELYIPGVLGSSYHNFHHTHYKYNYGHLTTGMDWLFGTLIEPKVGVPQRRIAADKEEARKSS
jgi:lathosterol oxidase